MLKLRETVVDLQLRYGVKQIGTNGSNKRLPIVDEISCGRVRPLQGYVTPSKYYDGRIYSGKKCYYSSAKDKVRWCSSMLKLLFPVAGLYLRYGVKRTGIRGTVAGVNVGVRGQGRHAPRRPDGEGGCISASENLVGRRGHVGGFFVRTRCEIERHGRRCVRKRKGSDRGALAGVGRVRDWLGHEEKSE